jgi:hypothetical protein
MHSLASFIERAQASGRDGTRKEAFAADRAEKFVLGLRDYASFLRGLRQTPETEGLSLAMSEETERMADMWQKKAEEWREKAVTLTNRKSNGG